MSTAGKGATSTSGINRLRFGVRSLSSAILAAVGRDTQPTGHPDVTVTTRLRDDMRSVTWLALDTKSHPFLVRVCRATALPAHTNAFKESALLLKKLHDEGPIAGLLPVLSVSEDGHSFLMPALTTGTVLEVPVLGWELGQTMDFFIALCRTVSALHEAGHFIGRWSASDVLLDDDFSPVLACDLDTTKGLPFEAKERDYFAPEVVKDEPVDARSDVFTLGKILEVLVQHAEAGMGDVARKSSGFGTLVAIVGLSTSTLPAQRYATVDALIKAVEDSLDMLPEGHLAPDRFALESVPPPKPVSVPKPVTRPAPIAPPSTDIFSTPPADAEPPRLEPRWFALAALGPAIGCGVAFAIDPSEGLHWALAWGAALLATVGMVRAMSRFPLRARVPVAFATLVLLLTFDPVDSAGRAGIDRRMRGGDPAAREKQIKTLLDRGRKSFPGQNLSGVSLVGANLVMVDVSNGDLSHADLSRAKLGGLIADHTNVSEANFEGADLSDVDLAVTLGWDRARCNGATKLPPKWVCSSGHLAKQ